MIAGSVIASTPAERGQYFFYDPARGSGLSQSGGVASLGNTLGLLLDAGGGFRALFTGTLFNMTGRPSTEWLRAPENDVGLDAFHAGLEAAIAGDRPQRRATALARALLALGGVLTVLEDAGEPAHVRNDFRQSYLVSRGPSPFDRGSPFERFVSETYGRMGVPTAVTPVRRPTVTAFITAADGAGAGRSHAAPLLLGRVAARGRRRGPRHDGGRGDAGCARVAALRATRGCRGWS